ncbi:MAG: hypothetical protein AB7F51_12670, partial [Pseudorhodoplanes sp.]
GRTLKVRPVFFCGACRTPFRLPKSASHARTPPRNF